MSMIESEDTTLMGWLRGWIGGKIPDEDSAIGTGSGKMIGGTRISPGEVSDTIVST